MPTQYSIQSDIDLINTLRTVTQVYQEIAVMKMQKVRNSVLVTRDYLTKLSEIFYEVKRSYKKELEKLIKSGKNKNTTISQAETHLSILLSPNTKLYGDIVYKVVQNFITDIKKNKDDEITIIGRLGKELFTNEKIVRPFTYFEIPDSEISTDDLRAIISHIANFDKIKVYYPRFDNIINQHSTSTNISGDEAMKEGEELNYRERSYLFEPNLETILTFFKTQMLSSLFKQIVHESQLARFASRIHAMEEPLDNINARAKALYSEQNKLNKLRENKRQLERLAGISLWIK